jgi:hypothetical protein
MKISEIKKILSSATDVTFETQNGVLVPEHFHVTEIGVVSKHYIDCGGTVRKDTVANFQLWDANDFEHRLKPAKLLNIISLSEKVLGMEDLEIEVEYQSGTIGKYTLDFNGRNFILVSTQTACLAKETCGTPQENNQAFKSANSCCQTTDSKSSCC